MCKAFGPAHLADVHQPFDSIFEPDKHAVVHHIYDFAFYPCSHRITLFDIFPGTGRLLFQAQRNLLVFLINANNNTFDFLVKLDDFRWM